MLPRRQHTGKRPLAAHAAKRVGVRSALVAALALVFVVLCYSNLRFFSSTSARTAGATTTVAQLLAERRAALESKLLHDHRQVQHVVFTSGCAPLDVIHSEVLASTLRSHGYTHNISHLVYGCTQAATDALAAKKNPALGVHVFAVATTTPPAEPTPTLYSFGEGHVTTTLHIRVVHTWLNQQIATAAAWTTHVRDNDFLLLIDKDALITKKLDVRSLFREAEDVVEPHVFGQDAAWYAPGKAPLSSEEFATVRHLIHANVASIPDWRPFAATAPYVIEFGVLQRLLPTASAVWSALPPTKRHLALPLAAAHGETVIGISGVLSVHHYPSRYENWDFVDDVVYNPCNETARVMNPTALLSYPISIRPLNFTLPNWLDGMSQNVFSNQLPPDLLACDAWLLQEPKGYLWHLASHTNGYERIPTILRQRHTMSVCLATQAYNQALVTYKRAMCPFGFNSNKKLMFALKEPARSTALAMTENDSNPVYFGDAPVKTDVLSSVTTDTRDDDVHFVFTTTCDAYMDWQSHVLAHSFAAVGQRGRLTRIVSGCSDAALKATIERTHAMPQLHLHATIDYSNRPLPNMTADDDYAPYNKPFGIRHWLLHANPRVFESMIVILDPDFMFLKPFVLNAGARVTRSRDIVTEDYEHDYEVIEGLRQLKRFFVYEGSRSSTNITDYVINGTAIAQRWSSYLGAAGFEDRTEQSTNFQVCPDCKNTSEADGREYYAVGPPYALTRTDLVSMIDQYCTMTVGKRERHRDVWMAEMMGYVLATAHHKIKHTTFDNLALAGKDDEDWTFVDRIKGKNNPCDAHDDKPLVPADAAPLLHGCHTYTATDDNGHTWVYYKQYMPDNLFTCDAWLLALPPPSVWEIAKASSDRKQRQHAYGLCTTIKVVNQALLAFKQQHCTNGFNANKKLRLVDKRAASVLEVGNVPAKWAAAAAEIEEAMAVKESSKAPGN